MEQVNQLTICWKDNLSSNNDHTKEITSGGPEETRDQLCTSTTERGKRCERNRGLFFDSQHHLPPRSAEAEESQPQPYQYSLPSTKKKIILTSCLIGWYRNCTISTRPYSGLWEQLEMSSGSLYAPPTPHTTITASTKPPEWQKTPLIYPMDSLAPGHLAEETRAFVPPPADCATVSHLRQSDYLTPCCLPMLT